MIFDKNRVNNEMDNIDCNIVEDAKTYLTKYIKIVSDKQVLIYSVSDSIDELMEGLDVNSSNDTATKEVKDFKKAVIKSIDKFNSYIKQETKKKNTPKENIKKVNDKNSVEEDTNNKPATNVDIKAHIKNKQKLIKQRFKSLLKIKKTIKNNIELIYSSLVEDFKKAVIKSIDKFNSYIKQETKKKNTPKENIKKVNDKNSVEEDTNNKPATNVDIKAHIKNKQKLIKQRFKSLLKIKKTIKNNIELIYSSLVEDFKKAVIKSIDKFNSYIKQETKKKNTPKENIKKVNDKNSVEEDTNNKPATNVDIKAHIKNKQKLIKQRFKSLLKTKKTIKNNIELIYSSLKRLPKEPQPKLIELIGLDTISNDSINVVLRKIYETERKPFKKIDANKVKNVYEFINKLINVTNNKTILLKTTVITKLNCVISDLKVKSGMDDIYNFNDIDKLSKINNDLDKYMDRLKKEIGSTKTILKTISTNQTDSHQTLMKLLN